jgi:hypothetical protein
VGQTTRGSREINFVNGEPIWVARPEYSVQPRDIGNTWPRDMGYTFDFGILARFQGGIKSLTDVRWVFSGIAPVTEGKAGEGPRRVSSPGATEHPRCTVGLVIPCRVAPPQSPTPFHQASPKVAGAFRGCVPWTGQTRAGSGPASRRSRRPVRGRAPRRGRTRPPGRHRPVCDSPCRRCRRGS